MWPGRHGVTRKGDGLVTAEGGERARVALSPHFALTNFLTSNKHLILSGLVPSCR